MSVNTLKDEVVGGLMDFDVQSSKSKVAATLRDVPSVAVT